MKILITTDWYAPDINGVVTSVLGLERELRDRGCEVKVLTLAKNGRPSETENVYYMRSFDVNRIYPQARAVIPLNKRCMDELTAWGPDLIHSQCEFSSFLAAKKLARRLDIPIVHTYHTVYEDYTHYFSPSQVWGKRAVACFSRLILDRTDQVIVPTEKVKQILDRYEISAPVAVIPSGIPVEQYCQPEAEIEGEEIRKSLGIPEHHQVMIFVGRMAKEKNIEELLEYFDRLDASKLEFLLVGDGPYRRELERLAETMKNRERIHFAGMAPRQKVAGYYQAGDVFVCASTSETQGLTYMEALASGLPVVCRKDPCVEGYVEDGQNGYQYENFEQFTRGLSAVLYETDRAAVRENARRTARRNSTQIFGERVMEVYRKTLERWNGGMIQQPGRLLAWIMGL